MILLSLLIMKHEHTLSFLCVYLETNLFTNF